MSWRTRFGLILAAAIVVAGLMTLHFWRQSRREALKEYRCTFPVMGTVASFTFYSADPGSAEAARRAALAEFERVVKLFNLYDPDSELARLNASAFAAPFACGDGMWEVLAESRRAFVWSGGHFDITVKPLMDLWGFYRKRGDAPPSAAEIAAVRAKVGMDKLVFDERRRTVRFTVEGMALDLGGVAKGYAVDRAAAAAERGGVRSGVIDLGGNLKFLSRLPPGRDSYRVGIRDPERRFAVVEGVLKLTGNMAVSTSGDYERFVTIRGRRYGHIMSPFTGTPPALPSVTVVTDSAMRADWLSTAIYLGGDRLAERFRTDWPTGRVVRVGR